MVIHEGVPLRCPQTLVSLFIYMVPKYVFTSALYHLTSLLLPTERRGEGPGPSEPHRLQSVHPRAQRPDSRAETRGETPVLITSTGLFLLFPVQILILFFAISLIWRLSKDRQNSLRYVFCFEANRLVKVSTTPRHFLCGADFEHLS